jgi:hypothetical protein
MCLPLGLAVEFRLKASLPQLVLTVAERMPRVVVIGAHCGHFIGRLRILSGGDGR